MKIVSLLSLLLLTSTDCLAHMVLAPTGSAVLPLFAMSIGFLLLIVALLIGGNFLINFLLLTCFHKFLLKDHEITYKKLRAAAAWVTLILSVLNIFAFLIFGPEQAQGFGPRPPATLHVGLFVGIVIFHLVVTMFFYREFFENRSKWQVLFMTLFVYLLNPIQIFTNIVVALTR